MYGRPAMVPNRDQDFLSVYSVAWGWEAADESVEGSAVATDRLLRRQAGRSYDQELLTSLSRRRCITGVRRKLKLHMAETSTAGR